MKISAKDKPDAIHKVLNKLKQGREGNKKLQKSFADFYGNLLHRSGDGLDYQQKQRGEWK